MQIAKNQEIMLGNVSVTEIAQIYGTPTYVYLENKIRCNYQRALAAFKRHYDDFKFYYAIKACNNLAVAHILRQEGAGIDAASVNEILLAKAIGLAGHDIMFSGNYISDEDIKEGLRHQVVFNLDDITSLDHLLAFGKPEILSFRVNPGYGQSDVGSFVTNAGPEAKFGLHPDQVMAAYKRAKEAGIKRFGAHMMPGSSIRDPAYFAYITELIMDILGKVHETLGIEFEFVDLGGGLGIPYKPGEIELDIDLTAQRIVEVYLQKCQQYRLKPARLVMEPARYFVGNAGYLVGRVHVIKTGYQPIVGTDIGMNVLGRPVLYNAYHHLYVNKKEGMEKTPLALCGQICENTDLWIKSRMLPRAIEVGDLVVVENVGAYGYSMSYSYNGRLKPAEVLVRDNSHHLIRKRETFDDIISGVQVPSDLKA